MAITIEYNNRNGLRGNQSVDHNKLCDIGRAFLYQLGCRYIGKEVNIREQIINKRAFFDHLHKKGVKKKIIDVVGVGKKAKIISKKKVTELYYITETIQEEVSRGMEAKISIQDFNNGFVDYGLDYIYIIAPQGVIPKNKIQKRIGFIEVDLDRVKIHLEGMDFCVVGAKLIKKPSRLKKMVDNSELIRKIAYHNTLESVKWNKNIEIVERKVKYTPDS